MQLYFDTNFKISYNQFEIKCLLRYKMEITKNIVYVGVNDHEIDLFERQYDVPNGMSYNSYVILDDKVAILDSVDERFAEEWLKNIEQVLNGKEPDFLVVQHMEPDHSGSVMAFAKKFTNTKIVASARAFVMMKNFFGTSFEDRQVVVAEGTKVELGTHTLSFIEAPMVHWPEVVMTYEESEKVLFSADAFGKFGSLDVDEEWACEARRYYIGIVGKYGLMVQNVLKKAANLDIEKICPLHGPVLTENLAYYINLYDTWSSYKTESEGVVIAYTSVYGNTKKAVEKLATLLEERGQKVVVNDLARCDMAEAVEDAFRYGKIVFATTTYNGEVFPFMREFISDLVERNFQNKLVGFIENGTWAPMATRVMKTMLEKCKDLKHTETNVKIVSALSEENLEQLVLLADELCKK